MSAGAQGDHQSHRTAEPAPRTRQASRRPRTSVGDTDVRLSRDTARRSHSTRLPGERAQSRSTARDQRERRGQSDGPKQRNRSERHERSSRSERSSGRQPSQPLPERILGGVYRHRRPLIALGIVLVVFLALYGPIQRYYVAWRTQGDEQAKADYLNGDNDALKQDIDRLTTRSGVENEARERGYRYPNEDVNASATSNVATDDADQGSDALNTGFSYDDIQHPWYIDVFDIVFMYTSPEN